MVGSGSQRPAGKRIGAQFRTDLVQDRQKLMALQPDWESLVTRVPGATIFQTFQWNACWWKAFGGRDRLLIITCRQKGRVVGIAPMSITRGRFLTLLPRTEIRFIGCRNYASDYLDFIVDPEVPGVLQFLLEKVLSHLKDVDRIRLSHFRTHCRNYDHVKGFLGRLNRPVSQVLEDYAPYRSLGNSHDDEKVINKSSIRRHLSQLGKSGQIDYLQCARHSDIERYLNAFFEQHVERYSSTPITSQFLDPTQRRFYRELATSLLPKKWLRFDILLLDDEPLAYHFGFEFRNRITWYKPTFNIAYANRSPGLLMLKFVLEDAIERGVAELDFTIGRETYKYRYANGERCNQKFLLFRSRLDYWGHRIVSGIVRVFKLAGWKMHLAGGR